ncbi:poly [ADP-ribose] polymerase 1-like [Cotesia typhae]|uniref:poly [ADP-ribose] polymerase 1-like n=1 Tax=Cotesia typhae TaxID=2053667 RepID=UPI003D69105F
MEKWEQAFLPDERMQKLIDNCEALKMEPELVNRAFVYTTEERKYSQIWTKEDIHDNEPIYYYYRIQILELLKDDCKEESSFYFIQNWGAFDTINHRKRSESLPLKKCRQKFIIQSGERSRNYVFARIKENNISKNPLPASTQNLIINYIFEMNFLKKMIYEYTYDIKNTITEFLEAYQNIRSVKNSLSRYFENSISKADLAKKLEIVRDLLQKQITSNSQIFCLMNFYYKQLHTTIEPLDKNIERYKTIEKYFNNTQSSVHTFKIKMVDLFVIDRPCDSQRYTQDLENKQLLWHGTSPTNVPYILYEGFRTTKANSTGMFGSGIYFANSVTKSVQYCKTSIHGVLLLCEVALGNTEMLYRSKKIKDNLDLSPGKNSVHGIGVNRPNPSESVMIDENVLVPFGQLSKNEDSPAILHHDEFIVYHPAQIKMRYLVTFTFVK